MSLLNLLASMASKERDELVEKEEKEKEDAVKGEKRRVSFEEKEIEIPTVEDQDNKEPIVNSSVEKTPPGILKSQKSDVSKNDVEKDVVKRCRERLFNLLCPTQILSGTSSGFRNSFHLLIFNCWQFTHFRWNFCNC